MRRGLKTTAMKVFWREFTRNGIKWEISTWHSSCWDHIKDCQDCTNYWKQYGFFPWAAAKYHKALKPLLPLYTSDGSPIARRFDQLFERMMEDGWIETEHSLSWRAFEHTARQPGKFWIVSLDGTTLHIQFGRFPKEGPLRPEHRGQRLTKNFLDGTESVMEYHKLIRRKLAAGYREVGPRQTPFSIDSTNSPVSAPKTMKKPPKRK